MVYQNGEQKKIRFRGNGVKLLRMIPKQNYLEFNGAQTITFQLKM